MAKKKTTSKKTKKYVLTPAHRAKLKPHAEKWIANALSTSAMTAEDQEICRDAVRRLYKAAGYEPPPDHRIVFVASPFILRFAAGFASWIWYQRKLEKNNNAVVDAGGVSMHTNQVANCGWHAVGSIPIDTHKEMSFAMGEVNSHGAIIIKRFVRDATRESTYDAHEEELSKFEFEFDANRAMDDALWVAMRYAAQTTITNVAWNIWQDASVRAVKVNTQASIQMDATNNAMLDAMDSAMEQVMMEHQDVALSTRHVGRRMFTDAIWNMEDWSVRDVTIVRTEIASDTSLMYDVTDGTREAIKAAIDAAMANDGGISAVNARTAISRTGTLSVVSGMADLSSIADVRVNTVVPLTALLREVVTTAGMLINDDYLERAEAEIDNAMASGINLRGFRVIVSCTTRQHMDGEARDEVMEATYRAINTRQTGNYVENAMTSLIKDSISKMEYEAEIAANNAIAHGISSATMHIRMNCMDLLEEVSEPLVVNTIKNATLRAINDKSRQIRMIAVDTMGEVLDNSCGMMLLQLATLEPECPSTYWVYANSPKNDVDASTLASLSMDWINLKSTLRATHTAIRKECEDRTTPHSLRQILNVDFTAASSIDECIYEYVYEFIYKSSDKQSPMDKWYVMPEDMVQCANVLGVGIAGLKCANKAYSLWQGGNQWSGYDSFLSFFRHVAKLPIDYTAWDAWEALSLHSGPRCVHENFCIISDRPDTLLMDENNEPHCETGPFCRWRDGSALYAVHGVRVPAWVIERKEEITPEKIDAESSEEIRRVMIEFYGWEKYLRTMTPIHRRFNERDQQWEELYRLSDGRHRVLLTDPSTGRKYSLGIPRDAKTCEEGQMWLSHGLEKRVIHRS